MYAIRSYYGEAYIQFHARNAERHLPSPWVTETTCPQGDVDLVGLFLDGTVINGIVVLIVKVDRDSSAPSLHSGWSIYSNQCHAGTMFHFSESVITSYSIHYTKLYDARIALERDDRDGINAAKFVGNAIGYLPSHVDVKMIEKENESNRTRDVRIELPSDSLALLVDAIRRHENADKPGKNSPDIIDITPVDPHAPDTNKS